MASEPSKIPLHRLAFLPPSLDLTVDITRHSGRATYWARLVIIWVAMLDYSTATPISITCCHQVLDLASLYLATKISPVTMSLAWILLRDLLLTASVSRT